MSATIWNRKAVSDPDIGTAKPRNDAFVGLLILSLLAQIVGVVFLYLEFSSYPDKKPPLTPQAPTKQYATVNPSAGI